MGKGRPRAVQTGQSLSVSCTGSIIIPEGPVFHPTEEEFKDPLEYIYKIRPEAEPYGICKIVPPKSWSPPFALNSDSFTFPTKTQAIHQLQARPASCDSKTFELEYGRFLEGYCGKKLKKKVVFEGEELDLCKLFNGARRFGGYDKVVKEKKWGEVFKFVIVRAGGKISECAKHVLCQLYREHLYDYECYYNRPNRERVRSCKRGSHEDVRRDEVQLLSSKRRRKNGCGDKAFLCKMEEQEEGHDQICEQCRSGLHGEVMLLCDRCNKGWHIYCLSPPLKQVPPGNWYCLECLNSDKDSFGFIPGKQYSLEAFRRVADRAKRKWFGSVSASRVQMEKKFWEIVEGSAGEVDVMYGSDLDTSVYGSGFPRLNDQRPESIEAKVWEKYCGNPWNLNNLPKLKGSMLRAVHHNITGVMVPWLYIGMLFSAFCWHFEDHCFYSMNYLHWGEPKCWYSVPGSEASAFEKVMRSCLPDLFDSQPDLLFQLVTMLNPSVLRENRVPVYSVLQEPGNFVITFPRSYHGGFNLGLNCAEAVNFAPADWLPHGGFGAELYKLYHKAAVLSHEELLCVVAKSDWDSKASPYLRKELLRMYTKERNWREKLWKSGIIRSSPMSPRKSSEYVGTEEDPTCIICKQYLYLSAVVCRCRPSAFVCLEHWEHLCECQSRKHRLLYRHNLAELYDLVLKVGIEDSEEAPRSDSSRRQVTCFNKTSSLAKKVKSANITFAQLAEKWLVRSCKVLKSPYLGHAYATLLKESEQFLWAGSEMDLVRDAVKNLIEVQKSAEGIRDCLSKVENCSNNPGEKVHLDYVDKLLSVHPLPCNESEHLKLKDCMEEARLLDREIEAALSTCSKINKLELLYSKALSSPIHLKQTEKLSKILSSAKAWKERATKHLLDKSSAAIDIDVLYQLRLEMLELLVEVPEKEMLLNLLSQAESCQVQCRSLLSGPLTLKDVGVPLQEMDGLKVNVPELRLLKQYHVDASMLINRFNSIVVNIHEREDQQSIVDELDCILKDGASLKIQVDEMSLVKIELEKACCREKALKARNTKMPLDFLQQLMVEAVTLQIEGEKFFADVSRVLAAAMHWEERAKDVLACNARMSEFEDLLRTSEDIATILPSLEIVKDAVSKAETWLEKSKSFLKPDLSVTSTSCFLLKIEDLKELVSQSKFLEISLEEKSMVEMVLNKCIEWEHSACSLLQDVECLYDTIDIGDGKSNGGLVSKIQYLVTSLKSVINSSLSLGFNFHEIAKLENACSTLQWCNQALLFCDCNPSCEDVEILIAEAERLSIMCTSHTMLSTLIYGVKWLKRASDVISAPLNCQTCRLSDAEEILAEYKDINVSFPMMVAQVTGAIRKHRLWQEDVHQFFALEFEDRSLSQMVQLKECGKAVAFTCKELDMVFSEVEKVEKWKQQCSNIIIGTLAGDVYSLLGALEKIKESLGKSLYIYEKLRGSEGKYLCMLCASYEDLEFLTCSTCKHCYHLRCLGLKSVDTTHAEVYICSYCHFFLGGLVPQDGNGLLASDKRPDLQMLAELLSDGEKFCVRIEEKDILQQLLEQAFACQMCLTEIVDFEMSYLDKDLTVVSNKLAAALKAIEVAITYDHQGNCNLERALARHSWRFRVNHLLDSLEKPTIKQIQQHLKEGMDMNILPGDYFRKKLMELKDTALQWANRADKVVVDSGALGLDKVYELIVEGEELPVLLEKELELLRARSMLHCICRKPYDERSMIACGRCNEWYHIACVELVSPPKLYICAACKPETEDESCLSTLLDHPRLTSAKFVEPKTPSPQHTKPRKRLKILGASVRQTSGIDRLWWQNRKPFRRAARKRTEFESLSRLFLRTGS